MRSTRFQNVLRPSSIFVEQACCSGVDGRSNLTAAAVGVSMILAPLHCGVFRNRTTSWNIPHGEGPFEALSSEVEILKILKNNYLRHRTKAEGGSYTQIVWSWLDRFTSKNDRRAALKRKINVLLGSKIIEEKSYAGTTAEL